MPKTNVTKLLSTHIYMDGSYSIKAGLSIGGTSPLPLPKEIRSIDSYAPNIAIAIEGNTTKWFGKDKKWGMTADTA